MRIVWYKCLPALLAAVVVSSCGRKIEGPAPVIEGVAPNAVCGEQLTTAVTLSGSGMSPLITKGLTPEGRAELPAVSLVQAQDLAGGAGESAVIRIPDDPADPASSRVRWMSQASMAFDVFPQLEAPPGLYTVHLENRAGKSADFADAFLVTPRPKLTSIGPDILCSDLANTITLDGDFFIKATAGLPTVSVGGLTLTPASAEQCRALPGPSGLEACRRLTVSLGAKALPPGKHAVVVTNPATVACASTDAVILTLVPEPTLTAVRPDLVCTAEGANALTATGTGFITIDGATPRLSLGTLSLPTTASNCTRVDGPRENVQSCTTLSATLDRDALMPGSYDAKVTNPVSAHGESQVPVKFTVVPPPRVDRIEADLVCTAEAERTVTVTGAGFLTVDGATPRLSVGATMLSTTASGCTPVSGPTETVATCTTLTAVVPRGTPAATLAVVVTNPAPAGCSSSQAVNLFVVDPPAITGIVPELTCAAQASQSLVISGTGFLTVNGVPPSVRVGSLMPAATPGGCTPFASPSPTETVQRCATLTVTIPQGAATGAQAVTVTNPSPAGCSSTQAYSLVIVPPPTLASVVSDLVCAAQGATTVVATGTGFLKIGSATPSLVLGTQSFVTTLSNCTPLTGTATVQAERCTTATANIPQGGAAVGLQAAKIVNPNPAGCESTEAVSFVSVPPPSVATIQPDLACTAEGARALTITGTGFIKLSSTLPQVTIGTTVLTPTAASGCTPVSGTTTGAERCTSLSVAYPQSASAGVLAVSVTNPSQVGCTSTEPVRFFAVGPPQVSAVAPSPVCTAQGTTALSVSGAGFLTVDGAQPTVSVGGTAYPATAADCTPFAGPSGTVQTCSTLNVTLPQASRTGALAVTVTNPAPAGCTSAEAVSVTAIAPPTLASIVSDLICTAEGTNTVTATGTGFIRSGAVSPTLFIGPSGFATTLSNCSPVAGTNAESCTTATAVLGQATAVDGLHAVKLVNPSQVGCETKESVSMVVAPPPSISTVVPDLTCVAQGSASLTINGSGFLKVGASLPSVTVGSQTLAASSVSGCTALSGTTLAAERCTSLSVTVPMSSGSGELAVVVENPAPASCSSAAARLLAAPAPRLSALLPPGICQTASAAVTVRLDGSDFLRVGGTNTPSVQIATRTYTTSVVAGSCTAVTGYSQAIDRCSALEITVNPGDLPGGSHATVVTNPAPAACSSTDSVVFNVTPPPTLTAASPGTVCAQGGSVDLTGTNFVPGMLVRLLSTPPVAASTVTVSSATTARATFVGPLPVGGPYAVEVITAGGGCSATLPGAVGVTDGPVVFFVDPPVVYNGIKTEATVYASAFSGNGLRIEIRRSGSSTTTLVPAQYDPAKPNRIRITLEAGLQRGAYDVLLSDANTTTCPGLLLNAFTVVDQLTLALTGIRPPFGSSGTETSVEITANPTTGGGLKSQPRFYLNPSTAGATATPLGSVSLIDSGRATAVVPAGLGTGTYSLIVVNPDGVVGLLTDAFKVVPDPIPEIDTVSPASLVTGQTAQTFRAVGNHFRGPSLSFRCQDAETGAITTISATVVSSTSTTIDGSVNTSSIANGQACLLRVTNSDQTFAEFSAVVFKNPAQKLTRFVPGPAMTTARRALVSHAGFVTRTAQFLYAAGGDDGTSAGALDTVEAVPLDLFGNPGTYAEQRNRLTVPRSFSTGQRIGRFLYLVGGRRDASTVLSSIERAYLLDPKDRLDVTDVDLNIGVAGPAPGVYHYRVSAVMAAGDAFNPGGENLPSDPVALSLPAIGGERMLSVTLRWAQVSGAAGYRVYRTAQPGDAAGTERLLAQVSAATLAYTDDGSVGPSGSSPLPIGSTGVWHVVGSLVVGREGAASAVAVDPSNASRNLLYVLGGRNGSGGMEATYEIVPVTAGAGGSQTVGLVATGATVLGAARWQLGAYGANGVNSPNVGARQFVYAAAGRTATGMSSRTEAAEVLAGGVLGTFGNLTVMSPARAGFGHAVANNYLFAFGGLSGAPDKGSTAAEISSTSPPSVANWQSTSASMLVDRYLMGSRLHGAFIYVCGGDIGSGATSSTEQIIW